MKLEEMYSTTGHLLRRAHQQAMALLVAARGESQPTGVQFADPAPGADHPGVDATRRSPLVACDGSTIGSVIDRLAPMGRLARAAAAKDCRVEQPDLTTNESALKAEIDAKAGDVSRGPSALIPAGEQRRLVRLLRSLVRGNDGSATRDGRGRPRAAAVPSRRTAPA